MLTLRKFLITLFAVSLLTGCIEDEDKKAIDDAFNPPSVDEPKPDDRVDTRICKKDRFVQPEAEITRKIDILFVVDTSGSLSEERGGIADGIDAFVSELPGSVDFQAGVLLAHGDRSPHSGKLYAKSGNPHVLNSTAHTMSEIRTGLRNNMTKIAYDGETDYGEVGLYSFSRAISDQLAWNKSLGFFREDAALAVIFVSDENDICSWSAPPAGVTLLNDPDRKEIPAAAKYCDGINPDSIYSLIKDEYSARPFLVSGIVYTNPDTVPRRGENEVGYGYIEAIERANGVAIDLANGDYELGMREIGFLATRKLNLLTEFTLSNNKFDERTLKVEVDKLEIPFNYSADENEVQISIDDAGGERSEVVISYCQPLLSVPINISNVVFNEPTPTTVMVTWDTELRSTSKLEFKDLNTGEVLESMHISFLDLNHSVDMNGLKPGTEYEVKVISTIQTNLGTEVAEEIRRYETPNL